MTTTSVFQGIGEGTKISSRVNYPPGGAARHSESREPQTVRVLKPPGGGSSISFTDTDYDFAKRPAKGSAPSTPVVEEVATTPTVEETQSPAAEATTPAEAEAVTSTPSSPTETNGTVKVSNDSSPTTSDPLPSPTAPPSSDVHENSSEVPTSEHTSHTNGISNGHHNDATIENGHETLVASPVSEETPSESVSANDTPATSNGVSSEHKPKVNLPPLHIQTSSSTHSSSQNSPTSVSPSVSSPSARGAPGETKDRLFGSPVAPSPPPPVEQPRKIKDHMKSSIFGSDDSYSPSRSSRGAAPAPVASPQEPPMERPTYGQRGRVPPGGFSSKLW